MEWQQWEFWAIALGVWLLLGLLRILSVVGSIRAQTCPLTEGMVASYTLFDYGLWLLLTPAMFTTATWVRFEPGRRLRGLIVHALVAILFGVT